MKNVGNKRYLESFKIFPYIAWGLVICFSLFVYGIAQNLRTVTAQVSAQSAFLDHTVNTPVSEISTFENQN